MTANPPPAPPPVRRAGLGPDTAARPFALKLRLYILLFLLVFGLVPLLLAVVINLPLVLERTTLFYQRAYLQNLRADFRDLDQHLASRHEMIRLLAKLPEPGLILGEQGEADDIDLARARYTAWINQILADQRDITALMFLGEDGHERFWLTRDPRTQTWHPTAEPPQLPNPEMLDAALELDPGAVMVSRIRVDPAGGARDPRRLITLSLVSPIGIPGADSDGASGLVVLGIDVGGLAQFYRDTVWVNQDGSYLRPGVPPGAAPNGEPAAFADFPGLKRIFRQGNLALWKGEHGRQFIWVPMFVTEQGRPLWVGRAVDPSPIDDFRNALMLRVLSIILVLVVSVLILARRIAARAERFGQELTGGIRQILQDGQPLWFHWRGPAEIRELGDQLTALARTHAEHLAQVREHTRELERSNRYKSEFLANVSHELRTPLNSILLLSKMLAAETSGLGPAQRRQAQVIHEAGADLRALIDNILDISRIEAGHVAVHLEWLDLEPILEELIELVEPLAADKPVALTLDIRRKAAGRIRTDRDKLRQILKNFLSNAIKFTDAGHVTLSLEPVREGGHEAVMLAVTDTGIGIPEDKQAIIFEAFQQADGSTRRRYGGTGLGLSISRELAGLLGGRITVRSAPGTGSRFALHLPVSGPAAAPGAAPGVTQDEPALLAGQVPAGAAPSIPAPDPSATAIGSTAGASAQAPARAPVASAVSAAPPPAGPAPGGERAAPPPAPGIPPGGGALQPSAAPSAPAQTPGEEAAGHWVLIVDRDVKSLVHLASLLDARGIAVQSAADLDEALETLQEDSAGCLLALVATLGSERETCATIEILLQQAHASQIESEIPVAVLGQPGAMSQLAACQLAGAVAFLSKPVDGAALDAVLDTRARARGMPPLPTAADRGAQAGEKPGGDREADRQAR